jgi:hypothetical protein
MYRDQRQQEGSREGEGEEAWWGGGGDSIGKEESRDRSESRVGANEGRGECREEESVKEG